MAAAPARTSSDHESRIGGAALKGAPGDSQKESVQVAATGDTVSTAQKDLQIMAQAVAELLRPTIMEAVDAAMEKNMRSIKETLALHTQQLRELEDRVAAVEEDLTDIHNSAAETDGVIKFLLEKVDDLENRSKRNNLRIVGLPEAYTNSDLTRLCSVTIPEALGLQSPCVVERALQQREGGGAKAAIAKYLNYADKALILQRFRSKRNLTIDGHAVLLFADYSIEVSRKRREFSKICTKLFENQIRFALAYPAILNVTTSTGQQLTFRDPREAEEYLESLGERVERGCSPPQQQHTLTQQRTPKQRRQQQKANRQIFATPWKARNRRNY